MAKIKVHINIPEEENVAVLTMLRTMQEIGMDKKMSVHQLGAMLHINTNRMRYILDELIAADRLFKVCIVDKGPRYKRFRYEVPNE